MEFRFRLSVIMLVGLLVVATWTYPQWRGFFVDTTVIEEFPGLALDLQDDFLSLPDDERQALLELREQDPDMALEMAQVLLAGDSQVENPDEAMDESTQAISTGSFIEIDALHWGAGTATIYQLPDQSRVLRLEDFSSARGGIVHVYLSRDFEPRTTVEVGVDFIDLGPLKGNIGNQNYEIPTGLDLSPYNSVVVFCRQFNTVITSARLQ